MCKRWKAALLSSQNLFDSRNDNDEFEGCEGITWRSYYQWEIDEAKMLISDGYLQVTKSLEIDSSLTTSDIDFIRSHAVGNQIEEFTFSYDSSDDTSVTPSKSGLCCCFSSLFTRKMTPSLTDAIGEIFQMSAKARAFHFNIKGVNQALFLCALHAFLFVL